MIMILLLRQIPDHRAAGGGCAGGGPARGAGDGAGMGAEVQGPLGPDVDRCTPADNSAADNAI